MRKLRLTALFFLVFTTVFTSCKDDDNPPPKEETPSEFKITFKPKFKGEDLTFNDMKWITNAGDTLNFTRLRMILSNIELIKTNGETARLDTFAYISFDEKRNILGFDKNLPAGNFKGIRFMIGLDSAINHGDPMQWGNTHPLNPLVNHMHWNWASGYIFWVAEGYYMNNKDASDIFSYHMANLNYRKNIELETSNTFSLPNGTVSKEIELHLDNYFSTPNNYSIKQNGASSHSSSPDDMLRMDLLHENLGKVFKLK